VKSPSSNQTPQTKFQTISNTWRGDVVPEPRDYHGYYILGFHLPIIYFAYSLFLSSLIAFTAEKAASFSNFICRYFQGYCYSLIKSFTNLFSPTENKTVFHYLWKYDNIKIYFQFVHKLCILKVLCS